MNVDALEWRVRRTGVIAAGLCLSVALLVWFGFRAVREWQRSSALFTLQRTTASADQLSAALMRDMRGAGNFVLGSSQVNRAPLDRSYELDRLLVSAFARYPYPESFFGWRGVPTSSNLTFFDRVDRLPPWASQPSQSAAFPVVVTHEAAIAKELVGRILEDTDDGVEWSLFELTLAGVPWPCLSTGGKV